jgi:hypothetical protein
MNDFDQADFDREYDRSMLRSELVSLFWAVVTERKKAPGGYTLQQLADSLGINKSQVSRWFNGLPNWEANTIADIASALGVDLQVVARDRHDGRLYTPVGARSAVVTTATTSNASFITGGPKATGARMTGKFQFAEVAA